MPQPRGTRIRLESLAGTGEARTATVLEGMGGYRTGSEFATVSVEVYRVLLSEVVNAEHR